MPVPMGPDDPAPLSASSPLSVDPVADDFIYSLKPGTRLLVAYSGGGDSTALLVALNRALLRHGERAIAMIAATVDHGLRQGSAREAEQAGKLCRQLGIEHVILSWRGHKPETGLQAKARQARYRLLADLAQERSIDLIVTGHNRDDAIETQIMRQARNATSSAAMASAVLIEGQSWAWRPFLGLSRQTLRDYLRDHAIAWSEDPSNDNEMFERVRVRKARLASGHEPGAHPGGRGHLALAAANWLERRCELHALAAAAVMIDPAEADDPAVMLALTSLIAAIGGRAHLAGLDSRTRLAAAIGGGEKFAMTLERVVIERRRQGLFVSRESRGLDDSIIAPGQATVWDGRYRISNRGREEARVAAATAGENGQRLVASIVAGTLPETVRRRAEASLPVLCSGEGAGISIAPVLANFAQFVPLDLFALAQSLARLAGLAPFPRPPVDASLV